MLAKRTSKNQITLPKDVAKRFPDTVYFDVTVEGHRILLQPVDILPAGATMERVKDKILKLGLKEKDVEDAIRWARRRKN